MHELSVTESVLEICNRYALQAEATKVTDIYLVIGRLLSIVDDSIQFYWDMISENTIAQGAKLHFKRVPVEIVCTACGHSYHPTSRELLCPKCASTRIKVKSGEEFYLEAIEVES